MSSIIFLKIFTEKQTCRKFFNGKINFMERQKVMFMGSHSIALPLLEHLLLGGEEGIILSGIVTQPDRRSGRGQKLLPNAVAQWALEHTIPLFRPEKPREETIRWMGELGCDLILVMAYGHILGRAIRELPARGIFNFHASLLPRFRGAAPIEAAIASGVSETGISLMEVVKEMDAGDVLDREAVAIEGGDNAASVTQKLSLAAKEILKRNLHSLLEGTFRREVQDPSAVTFCRKIEKEDMGLNFHRPARELIWRIRALTPHLGCVICVGGEFCKIESERWLEDVDCEPCQIFLQNDHWCIGCGQRSAIVIGRLQKPGKKMLPVGVFFNGHREFFGHRMAENFAAMEPFESKIFPF
jgi:methionyl-tRNA formyltransferase